jgi:thiamine pyrophosphokinase
MLGILLLNGQPYTGEIDDKDCVVYCCDGAYEWARGKVRIDKNIGDFDSLPYMPTPPPEEVYPSEKDFTDGEIAINKMLDFGVDEMEIYGGFGGREDHFLGNLQLLYRAYERGAKAKMISEHTIIFLAGGCVCLGEYVGKTLSVLPFIGDAHITKSTGFKYAYPEKLSFGTCRGISNVVNSSRAELSVGEGDVVLIIVNRGSV